MRLQVSTDYAIRILRHLHSSRGQVQTAMEISNATGVTYPFFIKVANQLRKKDLLSSTQGRNGGYLLGRPAHEISLYDVLRAVEEDLEILPCMQDKPLTCSYANVEDCKTYRFFCNMQGSMIAELSNVSIADLTDIECESDADIETRGAFVLDAVRS